MTPHDASRSDVASQFAMCPVEQLSRSFPARPSSLPSAYEFVDAQLARARRRPPRADLAAAINTVLLAAAGPERGSFTVTVRHVDDDVEVDLLATVEPSSWSLPSGDDSSFAQWFAGELRRGGLSQDAAARQLGVSVRTVGRWLRGRTEPRMRDVRRVNELFGPQR